MNEQNMNLKLCFKHGKTPKETYAILVHVNEDQILSMKSRNAWFARFREGRESVSDNLRSGKSATFDSEENIEKVMKLIIKNPRLTVRMIADKQNINRKTL
ncbi:uncharacterized protein TNCV_2123901 [Trichonephila clavipes]|nr:uncharacterized protein TNCV_2123901 [Trichonephila clavipes]